MRRSSLKYSVVILAVCTLAGCPAKPSPQPTPKPTVSSPAAAPKPAAKLTVAVNVWALTWLVAKIGGDLVDAPKLFEAPAHQQPSAEDLELLNSPNTHAVIYIGNLSGVASKVLAERAKQHPRRFVDLAVTPGVNLVQAPLELADDRLLGGQDPHVWLDPGQRMTEIATAVTTALTFAVNEHTELGKYARQYTDALNQRRDAAVKELQDLSTRLHGLLDTCKGRTVVPEHPAYEYLTSTFGLQQFPLTRVSAGRTPPQVEEAQRQKLRALWAKESPRVIFLEQSKGFGAELRDDEERLYFHRVANEHNAGVRYLSSLEAAPEPIKGKEDQVITYPEAMTTNAEQIKSGLKC